MLQYFKDIISLFSITQRLWVLTILCASTFFITFGSDIIEVLKPDPSQLILVVKRQKKQITSMNTQLDSLTFRVDDLTQEVIDGQSECTRRRINREKEIIAQIDEIEGMVRDNLRNKEIVKRTIQNSKKLKIDTIRVVHDEPIPIEIDNSSKVIKGLCDLKNKIKNNK
jgi:hypothetical protein